MVFAEAVILLPFLIAPFWWGRSVGSTITVGYVMGFWVMFLRSFSLTLSSQGLSWEQMMRRRLLEVRNLKPGQVPRLLCSHLACSCSSYVCWVAIVVWMVMAMCFRILVQGKLATQRELFYKLLCDAPEYFRSQRQVNRAVQGHFSLSTPNSVVYVLLLKFAVYPLQMLWHCSVALGIV